MARIRYLIIAALVDFISGLATPSSIRPMAHIFLQGFLLSFSGGQNDRRFDVAFYCDPDAGQGSLVVANPAEQPQLDYHLQWRTAYACPTNSTNPAQGFECCLYEYSKEPEKTKALCLDNSNGNEQCPGSLGSYEFIGQWQVDNCSDCYFHDRRSARAQIARL
jgi:hypothetical protein